MARWRFYQGLRTEWRWYRVDEGGGVVAESDRGFAELQGCMANAEAAGFTDGEAFQVYTREAGSFIDKKRVPVDENPAELPAGSADAPVSDEEAAR
jgi:hypothetical protein